MKQSVLILLLAAGTTAALAQTPAKPATTPAKHTTAAAKHTMAAKHAAGAKQTAKTAEEPSFDLKVTDGVPKVPGVPKTMFLLRYKDVKVGSGPEAAHDKLYSVQYTGWLAANGHKFDSSYDHPRPPVMKDGKPVMGADGKPEQGPPQPIRFPQGYGRVIPGFDQGFAGMHVGGTRLLYIPWQLGYGARGRPGPDAAHPGIPPYADLVFEINLVAVDDMPASPYGMMGGHGMPGHGMPPGMHGMPGHPMPPGMHPMPEMHPMTPDAKPAAPEAPKTPAAAPAPAAAPKPAAPTSPAQPQSK